MTNLGENNMKQKIKLTEDLLKLGEVKRLHL